MTGALVKAGDVSPLLWMLGAAMYLLAVAMIRGR